MLLSKRWLEQYLPKGINLSEDELRDKVTSSLAEVEDIYTLGKELKNIVVGEVNTLQSHPHSDKLHVVIVDTGNAQKRTIVCAANNLFEGAKVPVALPGGTVYNPDQALREQSLYEIKMTEIRKVRSQGMLASQKELGISENHEGIWILPSELKVGDDFVKILQDTVFEIENKSLTNRPDCFCHLGIARELSAILKTSFDYKKSSETLIATKTLPLVVKVENEKLCKRYTAIALQGVKIRPSPFWLQMRLLSCGVRPINNIVDATNYVMLDVGQPLHAFDYNKLSSPRIIVRESRKGEKLTTLDEVEREFSQSQLLITDPDGPIAIAGIIGGAETEVSQNTKDIVIESANFEMYNIRRSTKELGIRTEASTRMEKGLDPELTIEAIKKVVELILEIAGGEVASELIDIYPDQQDSHSITFEIQDITRLLGVDIPQDQVVDILESLGLKVELPKGAPTTKMVAEIPSSRRDLHIKEDVLEEIARIYGYDKFTPTLPNRDIKPVRSNPSRKLERKIKDILVGEGFDEIYTYSFVGEELYKKALLDATKCIKLLNPVSPELGYMRSSLVPSILEKVQPNLANFSNVSLFEISRIYLKNEKNDENLPKQPKNIIVLTTTLDKNQPASELFPLLKGKLTALLSKISMKNYTLKKCNDIVYLHPSQQAIIKSGDEIVGQIGTIHPKVKENFKIEKDSAIFILDFEKLLQLREAGTNYKKISKFPTVKRDLSFWVDIETETGTFVSKLRQEQYQYITGIDTTDIYTPKDARNRKSITIQIEFQSGNKTLQDNDIKKDTGIIYKAIEKAGGKIRK